MAKPIRVCKFDLKTNINKQNNKNLLVKNLDSTFTTKDLNKLFEEFGEITSCKIEFDENGKSKEYGYVSYADPENSNKAIEKLRGKEINGKVIDLTVLIPSRNKCCIYVKNFPRDFTEIDLKKFFSKFGEITGVVITRDLNGASKGFGFITFGNFQEANDAIKQTNEQQYTFPGCPPLFASLPVKKEERQYIYGRNVDSVKQPKIFARLIDINGVVKLIILLAKKIFFLFFIFYLISS